MSAVFAYRRGVMSRWRGTAPTFVGAGTLAASTANATPVAPAYPAGTQANDIAITVVWSNQSNTFSAAPSGWNELVSHENFANGSLRSYWRRLVGGDAAPSISYVSGTSLSTSNGLYARTYVFRDCRTNAVPYEAAVTNWNTWNASNIVATTTTGPQRLEVGILAVDDDAVFSGSFPVSGWTEMGARVATTTGGDAMSAGAGRVLATATTTPGENFANYTASVTWHIVNFALIPVGG